MFCNWLFILYGILDVLKQIIKQGTFGIVWLSEDSINGEKYAIKEISVNQEIKKEIIERELEISKRIGNNHDCSGLVKIYDCFKEGESYYIVMEYCKEGSLSDLIKKHGKLEDEHVFYLILIVNIYIRGLFHYFWRLWKVLIIFITIILFIVI
jgi:serine/threonine protein kinase